MSVRSWKPVSDESVERMFFGFSSMVRSVLIFGAFQDKVAFWYRSFSNAVFSEKRMVIKNFNDDYSGTFCLLYITKLIFSETTIRRDWGDTFKDIFQKLGNLVPHWTKVIFGLLRRKMKLNFGNVKYLVHMFDLGRQLSNLSVSWKSIEIDNSTPLLNGYHLATERCEMCSICSCSR